MIAIEPKAPRDYVELPTMPSSWRVLDVGPGAYPLQRADVYLDHDPDKLEALTLEGKETIVANLADGLPEISDKYFDFVWCSHVLEHVDAPGQCAATLSRIAHRGVLVVPSAIKESLFNFEEPEHQWLILPSPSGGPPVFVRHNRRWMDRIKDIDIQKIMCRTFRTGTGPDTLDDQYCRTWFAVHEPDLDIIVHWEGELKVQVIG